ncbi:GntR family transcriptional regulator [Micromonospora sp. CPCC 206061]|uniref:GntR family transcriptional regulator n=1 Tax=Micromonospora sp. CPCC 206061 TaxID=3122410 RepID=UPI002FF2B97E
MPTPRTGTPRYRQVAEELRRRIEAGAIPAGSLLPPESALSREFGISRGTAREAIAALRSEGLVVTEHGRGTYARPAYPVRRLGANRYGTNNSHRPSDKYQVDATINEVPATQPLANMFNVEPGTMLLCRKLVLSSHRVPQQLSTSYFILETVAGTPLADPNRKPVVDNNPVHLRAIDIVVTDIREIVRARMPTPKEVKALCLPAGTPVLTVTRQIRAGNRVVEVTNDIVLPSDRSELEYEIPID